MTFQFSLVVGVILLLSVRTVTCGRLDEQLCADLAHKECKCDIAHAHATGKKSDLCRKLQSCSECMAIPRCHSRYLDEYRSLLLTTMKFSRLTSICPDIQYYRLVHSIKASRKKCSDDNEYTNRCSERCKCKDGAHKCYRVRKEFTQMSFAERRRYVSAFYKATTDPYYKDAFEKLLNSHSWMPTQYLHHMPQIFLPWHRWYLLKIENFLRQLDCRITIPYYQWTTPAQPFQTDNPRSVWSSGPEGLGGNGVPPDWCVKTGVFREGNWALPINKGGGCLKRNFNFSCGLYDDDYLNNTLQDNFTMFESIIREKLHNDFHDCVGELMHEHNTAGNTPEFLLHHSFIDKIWNHYQSKGNDYKFAYYTSLNIRMPQADRFPWEYLDNDNLPGEVRVDYQRH